MKSLQQLRKEASLKQSEIAEYIEVATSTYCLYENAQRRIPRDKAEKIAELFGKEVTEIFEATDFTTG